MLLSTYNIRYGVGADGKYGRLATAGHLSDAWIAAGNGGTRSIRSHARAASTMSS